MSKNLLKKRLDIIVEAPMKETITSKLDRARVSGYSVLPIIQGRGIGGSWESQGQISDTANMILVLCIVDASEADEMVDIVFDAMRDRIGFLTISDVSMVVR